MVIFRERCRISNIGDKLQVCDAKAVYCSQGKSGDKWRLSISADITHCRCEDKQIKTSKRPFGAVWPLVSFK